MPLSLQHSLTLDNLEQNMVHISEGEFDMGGESPRDDSLPLHRVSLGGFMLCRYPVTQILWEAIMGYNPSEFKGTQRPVEMISWNDTQSFIKKLNDCIKSSYRLPTEAEWEYAVRGGPINQTLTYSGSEKLNEIGWFWGNAHKSTHNIGQKIPNELGIFDMTGNVLEWCQDNYDSNYYNISPTFNPNGAEKGVFRILRGGNWSYFQNFCGNSERGFDRPVVKSNDIGFRLARSL